MSIKVFKNAVLLLFFVGTPSCQNINAPEGVLEKVVQNDEVIAFFNKHLPEFSGQRSDCFFVDNTKDNKCLIINNIDELRKSISCSSIELPKINFSSCTLIIGQHQMGSHGHRVVEQKMIVNSKRIELKLKLEIPEYSASAICPMYYWGIYTKIKNKPISVYIIN